MITRFFLVFIPFLVFSAPVNAQFGIGILDLILEVMGDVSDEISQEIEIEHLTLNQLRLIYELDILGISISTDQLGSFTHETFYGGFLNDSYIRNELRRNLPSAYSDLTGEPSASGSIGYQEALDNSYSLYDLPIDAEPVIEDHRDFYEFVRRTSRLSHSLTASVESSYQKLSDQLEIAETLMAEITSSRTIKQSVDIGNRIRVELLLMQQRNAELRSLIASVRSSELTESLLALKSQENFNDY